MTEGQKPDDKAEIEGILADLESILSEKAPAEGKPKSEPGIANIIAGLGDALKQAQGEGAVLPPLADTPPPANPPKQQVPKPPAAAPPAQARPPAAKPPSLPNPTLEIKLDMPTRPPASAPVELPSAKPPPSAVPPPAQARPTTPANPPPAQPRPLSPQGVPPAQARPPAAAPPPAQARPTTPANPPPAQPRPLSPQGVPPAQARPPVPANPSPTGPAAKPPMQPPQVASPVAAAKPAAQQPPAAAVPPSSGNVPKPIVFTSESLPDIPAEAPKDQIRKVAFLYSSGQKMPLIEFIRFVDSLALHFSKKPLYLRKAYLVEVAPDNDLNAVAEKIKASGAVGVVGVLPGIQENKVRSLETILNSSGISYYWLTPDEAFKRPVVLGLVVELMLLNAE